MYPPPPSRSRGVLVALLCVGSGAAVGCGDDVAGLGDFGTSSADTGGVTEGTSASSVDATNPGSGPASSGNTTEDPFLFDLGAPDVGFPGAACVGQSERNGRPCKDTAPADAFEPDVQWSWSSEAYPECYVTPLVANLTDDNEDGQVNLDDTPDVVVIVMRRSLVIDGADRLPGEGRLVVLSGDTGALHFQIPVPVNGTVTPAIGDINGDGLPEIVAVDGSFPENGSVIAFDHTGQTLWTSPYTTTGREQFGAVALADLEGDGSVEVLLGGAVYESTGALRFDAEIIVEDIVGSIPVAADLDDDGTLEVVHGSVAFRADGSVYYDAGIPLGYAHIGNFDGDDDPEILVTNREGLNLLDHTGEPIWLGKRPTGDSTELLNWTRPGTIHDFDGDCEAEFASSSANHYAVYEIDASGPTIRWQAEVADLSGIAGGTAFDFDGDGFAEAMYGDETQMFVFDGQGAPLLSTPRDSQTGTEYPVVADIDNDGSAEILVVSNLTLQFTPSASPTVQAIRDVDDRWIQARRIWNQHAYSVSNVNEDGTIPTVPDKSWLELNTFRTNAQIENGGICQPQPEG